MTAQLLQRDSLDSEFDLSSQEPPPWIIRWAAWLFIGASPFALVITIVMRLPETRDCRFVLIPATGADPIQSPRQAGISRVLVEKGQPVKAGEKFILRYHVIGGWYEMPSGAGRVLPLRVRMKGDAHIIVGGQALVEYAFVPIRQLCESTNQ
jgi:hypothetical protein